jgi:hypothetical protein
MIEVIHRANILHTAADTVLVPTNTLKVFGAGLAKEVHQQWWFRFDSGRLPWLPGRLYDMTADDQLPRIVSATTKDHWRDPSQLIWVESILAELAGWTTADWGRVAVPRLGCGLGGLDFDEQVFPLMQHHLTDTETHFIIYA